MCHLLYCAGFVSKFQPPSFKTVEVDREGRTFFASILYTYRCHSRGWIRLVGKNSNYDLSLDSHRKSNIWHFIKKRKTALKFFTFKLRLGPLLVHLPTRLICQIIPIYMLFQIFAWNSHFGIAIAKKIKENVKCLRLVKITYLLTVKGLTFRASFPNLN